MPKTVLVTGRSSGAEAELVKSFAETDHFTWFTPTSGLQRADIVVAALVKRVRLGSVFYQYGKQQNAPRDLDWAFCACFSVQPLTR